MAAFIYCGLPGRGFWLTAILAPRFLASAFASGPARLILLSLVIRCLTDFDPGKQAVQSLAVIAAYALAAACVCLFAGTWIDKGMGMISGEYVPSPLHHVTEYSPSPHELSISAGVTALGLFILTLLYKITISVKTFNLSGR